MMNSNILLIMLVSLFLLLLAIWQYHGVYSTYIKEKQITNKKLPFDMNPKIPWIVGLSVIITSILSIWQEKFIIIPIIIIDICLVHYTYKIQYIWDHWFD